MRYGFIQVALSLCFLPGSVAGQSTETVSPATIQELTQEIRKLQQHERELQERIAALEADKKTSLAPPPASAPQTASVPQPISVPQTSTTPEPATVPDSQSEPSAPVEAPEMHSFRGIQWRGFAEADYKVLNQRTPGLGTYGFVPGSAGNFYTGDFGLFLTAKISERASALTEIVFEEGDAQSYGNPDLRRILLNYDYNDHLRMSFGRNQTGIGYYNLAFRSAAWLQTTADRPLIMEFASDGGPLPTQAVGVSVTGTIPSGKLNLNYIAEYGSSDTIRPDINGNGLRNDENNGNYVNAALFMTPDRIPGLRIGGSIYHDQISDLVDSSNGQFIGTEPMGNIPVSPSARWNQTIVNGHVVYTAHRIEFLNEGFMIRHAPIGTAPGETFHTSAFYSQISRRFGKIRPFARYQYINASTLNGLYNDLGLRCGPSFGARYDVNAFLAFKAQLDHTVLRGMPNVSGLQLQLSGTF